MSAPPATAVHVDPDLLREFVAHVYTDVGMNAQDADESARAMVWTDLRGQHSHGVNYLPRYVASLRGGGIRPDAVPRVVTESAATALLDGDGGLGALVTFRACDIAAEKARKAGCAMVLVRNSNHFGAASAYTLRLAEMGLIGIVAANSAPGITAPGARTRMIGTQPFSFAAPDPDGEGPVMLDMAMSLVAGTKVRQAMNRGESIPEGWIVDTQGRPSTNPKDFADGGSLLAIGGHKGFALAILIEMLTGVLADAGITHGVLSHDLVNPSNTGHWVMAIGIEAFMPRERFLERLADLRAEVHGAPTADGASAPILPGEPEVAHERDSWKHGLELDPLTWDALSALAGDLGRSTELEALRR